MSILLSRTFSFEKPIDRYARDIMLKEFNYENLQILIKGKFTQCFKKFNIILDVPGFLEKLISFDQFLFKRSQILKAYVETNSCLMFEIPEKKKYIKF